MRAATKIADEIRAGKCLIWVIGIPKTINNDFKFVSRSFGYETALEKAAEAIQ